MDTPAIVHNARQDLVAANRLGRAPCAPHLDTERCPPDMARFAFLGPAHGTTASTGPGQAHHLRDDAPGDRPRPRRRPARPAPRRR
ncbi:MmyB family transcriptional regulator [Nocardiopsis alborubida]|uniref:MmyB family transcriptional regulator n=1 Tax=Nocardiopsis alborubida TaxID=146802 RepID=UPI001E658E3F|nr:hypothetical protein [Nocardiopsis alborubida]